MMIPSRRVVGLILLASLAALCTLTIAASEGETPMTTQTATGTFEVSVKPLDTYADGAATKIGRMSIDKTLRGDLYGTSVGEMLSGGSPAEGSAGYVAIERITGTLGGREGSFLLQHMATMTPEAQHQTIRVVPGSGTGELAGLAGDFTIEIDHGQHSYRFEYTLP